MKTLVVYYSYTGNTEFAARVIAQELKADLRRIEDAEEHSRACVYTFGILSALRGARGAVKPMDFTVGVYDRVLVGSPVWAGSPAPAVNTFIARTDFAGKTVIPFATSGGGGSAGALKKMSARIARRGGKVLCVFSLEPADKTNEKIAAKIKEILKEKEFQSSQDAAAAAKRR